MPKKWTKKGERQPAPAENSARKRGQSPKRAKEMAARAANERRRDNPDTPLAERTKGELYDLAKELGIAGRSRMTKDQLVRAVRRRR